MDVAKELIKEKLAEYCEESLMSKVSTMDYLYNIIPNDVISTDY